MKIKKINCWIEINQRQKDWCPTVSMTKPLKREIKCGNEFGFKTFKAEIIIKEEQK